MKSRMMALARAFALLMLLCMLTTAGHALAQPRVYTYGGSALVDELTEVAACPDGRLVLTGYTDSSDGTLAGRVLNGRTAWALCVDAQGNVLWSVCPQEDLPGMLSVPTAHEDGSVSAVLRTTGADGVVRAEVIRFGADGEILSRREMDGPDSAQESVSVYRTALGYVTALRRAWDSALEAYALHDWDGQYVHTLEGWFADGRQESLPDTGAPLVAQRHILLERDKKTVLCMLDEAGNIASEMTVHDPVREETHPVFFTLVSLPDGGAAAAGLVLSEPASRGCIVRWDAQGNRVFDWWMQEGVFANVVKTPSGFAALFYRAAESGVPGTGEYHVQFMDEDGVTVRDVPLGADFIAKPGDSMAALPGGGVALTYAAVSQDGSQRDAGLLILTAN